MSEYYFTEEHEHFRQEFRKFLDREMIPNIDKWEEDRFIPREVYKRFGEMGYFGLGMPEKYGGLDLDFFYQVVMLEEMCRVNSGGFNASVMAHYFLACSHIKNYGSEELKEKYLIPSVKGEIVGALAITEPSGGSDVASLRTTAIREGDYYIVNGSKTFITNGVYSDFIVAAVRTKPDSGSAGISMLLMDRNTPGVSATNLEKLGWHASDTGEIAFQDVRVPVTNLIGQENAGFYYIMDRFQLERITMAIGGYASAEFALNYALQYMNEREAFGRKINKFQALRHRIADLASEIEAIKFFTYHICRMENDGKYAVKQASMAKLLATELADKAMYQCLQFFGGYGYIEDYKIARMFRDSRIGTIGGGSSEIMREIISKLVIDNIKYDKADKMAEKSKETEAVIQ